MTLRSQVVTLNVIYDDARIGSAPELWDWTTALGLKRGAVEVLAAGPWKKVRADPEDE